MSTEDIPDLMKQVYDYFLNLFHQTSDAPPEATFLAFQQPGTPLSPEMFAPPAGTSVSPQTVALEVFSTLLANVVPALDADEFRPTGKTIDGFYEMLLLGSQFDPQGGSDQLFVALKSQAKATFDKVALGSVLRATAIPFHPAYTLPDNWYDPTAAVNWPTYSVSTGTPPPPVPATPPPIVRPHFTDRPWAWRVLPPDAARRPVPPATLGGGGIDVSRTQGGRPRALENAPPAEEPLSYGAMLTALVLEQYALPDIPPSGAADTTQGTDALEATVVVRDHRHGAAEEPVVRDHRHGAAPPVDRPPVVRVPSAGLQDILTAGTFTGVLVTTPPQPVESHSLSLSFQYCLVKIDRPWLSLPFLFTHDWYVPGYQAGEFSHGTAASQGGLFPALPITCLIAKDLKITADATEISTMAGQSGAFGPFALVGGTVDTTKTTLSIPGMQIFGWVCQMLPVLPPLGAPMTINVPNAGLYSQPGVAQPILTLLPQGTSVVPTAEETTVGDTVLIKVKAGNQIGWVNKQFLG